MASPAIPANVLVGLRKIATLPDESFQELIPAFEAYPLVLQQGKVFADVDWKLKFLSPEDAEAVKDAVLPIYRSSADGKVSADVFVDSIIQTLKDTERGILEWVESEDILLRLKDRLTRLVRIESLQLIAKAHNILLSHARIHAEARIFSDIRPVFGEKVEDPPKAAVIVHKLHLSYVQNKRTQEFVIALDTQDVEDLIVLLERAKAKTESLKSAIASAQLPYIEVKA